ncbi:hypothetical protein vBValMR11Z_350 [Vibrio phage vB_ValM_R11Z]|nr:hypothetical protein Va3_311 [Vibrio phage Va3]QNJ55276.1 hypothetical protein vBValMR11Z_350 [Vibrio phage vB_ValM_R11Z]
MNINDIKDVKIFTCNGLFFVAAHLTPSQYFLNYTDGSATKIKIVTKKYISKYTPITFDEFVEMTGDTVENCYYCIKEHYEEALELHRRYKEEKRIEQIKNREKRKNCKTSKINSVESQDLRLNTPLGSQIAVNRGDVTMDEMSKVIEGRKRSDEKFVKLVSKLSGESCTTVRQAEEIVEQHDKCKALECVVNNMSENGLTIEDIAKFVNNR